MFQIVAQEAGIATTNATTTVITAGTDTIDGLADGYGALLGAPGSDVITAHGLGNTIVGGDGINMIYGRDGQDIFTLPIAGQGFDDITDCSGANGDIFDLGPALLATSWDGLVGTLGNYLQVSNSNGATTLAIAADGTGSNPDRSVRRKRQPQLKRSSRPRFPFDLTLHIG